MTDPNDLSQYPDPVNGPWCADDPEFQVVREEPQTDPLIKLLLWMQYEADK